MQANPFQGRCCLTHIAKLRRLNNGRLQCHVVVLRDWYIDLCCDLLLFSICLFRSWHSSDLDCGKRYLLAPDLLERLCMVCKHPSDVAHTREIPAHFHFSFECTLEDIANL